MKNKKQNVDDMMIHASITAGVSLFSLVELLLTGHFERQDDLEVNV